MWPRKKKVEAEAEPEPIKVDLTPRTLAEKHCVDWPKQQEITITYQLNDVTHAKQKMPVDYVDAGMSSHLINFIELNADGTDGVYVFSIKKDRIITIELGKKFTPKIRQTEE
jgi:hypothetical protein